MQTRENTCCFTGHRPSKLPWRYQEEDLRCVDLKMEIVQALVRIYDLGYRHFLCGMAEGCDMFFADAVLAMRQEHPDVTLEAVIPCGDQPALWERPQRVRYNGLIDRCDKVTVLQIAYTPDCMQRRNRNMVDRSSLLLSCFNGSPGGTMSTILYAQRQGLEVIQIPIE